jgi:predicted  nucleic acid-binding Zn-ribbon protein
MHREGAATRAELLDELGQLDRRIDELRGARAQITYDLEHAVKARERLRRHLNAYDTTEDLDGAA